ncbi:trichohyalin-like isoform X2 [Phyllopteryx taeniolatus]|uniref:trichohyalin-like isoform X2 n=1 Tax=Phyllopteryx taeniolatus TaxID=161469 RepID=UPI002AD56AA0|nr:trichohyalin-like isoform X2 [Phyllopteryx taeniolatus]
MSFLDQPWCPTGVQVTVLQARGLRVKGKGGTNDAYALMQLGKDKYQTSVVEKSVAPVWKEEAAFELPQHGAGGDRGTLHVHVLHRALVGPDKLLGQAVVDLLLLSPDRSRNKTEWFKLLDKSGKADKDRGEVLVDIQFMRNNMTASMFDLSAVGKTRSRLGKLKDKVRGKKKEPDVAAPSFMQSNLERNMSQSMSILPAKNSSLSGSLSSGLNVDTAEGKKKFKFMKHKRSDSKESSFQKHTSMEKSNLCINGSHVYCEEPPPRTARIGSNFSLASSGHGSMEDVPESSPPPVDSLPSIRQYTPWEEEEEEEKEEERSKDLYAKEMERTKELDGLAEVGGKIEQRRREEEERERDEEKVQKEEEERITRQEARRQELVRLTMEKRKQEEEESIRRQEEEEKLAEEKRKEEEEERMRKQEEQERLAEEKRWEVEMRRQELARLEEKMRREEEERRRNEENVRKKEEEQVRRQEQERLAEEQRRNEEEAKKEERMRRKAEKAMQEKIKREDECVRRQEQERLAEEQLRLEEKARQVEEEKRRKEEEEQVRRQEQEQLAEEQRRLEEKRRNEERARKEEEEHVRRQEQERLTEEQRQLERRRNEEKARKVEEEKMRKEEEEQVRRQEQERLAEEQRQLEEKRRNEERARKLEEEKMRKEEEEQVIRQERERLAEEQRQLERRRNEEKARKLEEEKMRKEEEEQVIRQERERLAEEQRQLEEKRRNEEKARKVEEKRRKEEEEQVRRQEQERLAEEQRQLEEKRRNEEKARKVEEERVKRQEQERLAEDQQRLEEEERTRKEEERRRQEEQLAEEKRRQEEEERKLEEKAEEAKRRNEEELEGQRRREKKEEEKGKPSEEEHRRIEAVKREEEQKNLEEEEKRQEEQELRMRAKEEEERERRRKDEEEEKRRDEACQKDEKEEKHSESEKALGNTQVNSFHPFIEDLSNNPFADDIPNSPSGSKDGTSQPTISKSCHPPERSVGTSSVPTDEKSNPVSQREKRPAPQPPGRTRTDGCDKPSLRPAPMTKQLKEEVVKTASVSPQRTVQTIPPRSRSPTDAQKSGASKHTKRPAPSIPSAESNAVPVVYSLNPFEGDDDGNELAAQDEASSDNHSSASWPPPVSKTPEPDATSQSKVKSAKVARAPAAPAKTAATSSTLNTQSTDPARTLPGGESKTQTPKAIQALSHEESPPKKANTRMLQHGQDAGGKKEAPPAPLRRLQPVKPLSAQEQPPVTEIQVEKEKSVRIAGKVEENTKVKVNQEKGPYSMLTREELISLVVKQEKQMQNKEKKIAELEQYIDNLLVRIMEEQPNILMSMKKVV